MRGVLHQWAFPVSLVAGAALVIEAGAARARIATLIYALSVAALLGTSALYHRVDWRTLTARRWMRRLDHTMIFVLIAGTYTPFALLILHGTQGMVILVAVWSAALAGAVFKLLWIDAPGWSVAASYIVVGWVAVIAVPDLTARLGIAPVGVLALGGPPLQRRRRRPRPQAPKSGSRGVRLPRGVPPARSDRRRPAVRRRRGLGGLAATGGPRFSRAACGGLEGGE